MSIVEKKITYVPQKPDFDDKVEHRMPTLLLSSSAFSKALW